MKAATLVLAIYISALALMASAPVRLPRAAFPAVPQKTVKFDLLDKKDRELWKRRDPKLQADCEVWELCWNGLCMEVWRRGCSGRGYGGGGGGAF